MDKSELFDKVQCALTHNLNVCERCKKCEGIDFAEIRFNLINELKEILFQNN